MYLQNCINDRLNSKVEGEYKKAEDRINIISGIFPKR